MRHLEQRCTSTLDHDHCYEREYAGASNNKHKDGDADCPVRIREGIPEGVGGVNEWLFARLLDVSSITAIHASSTH